MRLLPLDNHNIPTAVEWMSEKDNYQWLEFGNGIQILTANYFKIMRQL